MPRQRFARLADEKRLRILEAAAKEFTARGYENASMNRILEAAGISKGAAYYYFDDKADLYFTTLLHYMQELLAGLEFDAGRLTAESFWEEVAGFYRHQFMHYYERPWVFGVARAGGPVSVETLASTPLAATWQSAQGLLGQLIRRGHELGVIRRDLPDDLLVALLIATDEAHDRWLYAHWAKLSPADVEAAAHRIADIMRRLLASGSDQAEGEPKR